jgi:hypothetical protein
VYKFGKEGGVPVRFQANPPINTLGMIDSLPDSETVLAQFNRLMQELLRGSMMRNTFRPWEIEILLDIETCELRDANKRDTLRRYQKAVQRHMERGARLPLKLSEYLDAQKAKRQAAAS